MILRATGSGRSLLRLRGDLPSPPPRTTASYQPTRPHCFQRLSTTLPMNDLQDWSWIKHWDTRPSAIACQVVGLTIVYYFLRTVYRLYFHPLAKFPGSRWAAISLWYEFYWNIVHKGALYREVHRLHSVYKSPIIRIGPNEIHVDSPEFYHEVFGARSKYIKQKYHYDSLVTPKASTGMDDPEGIRVRREAFKPIFSRKTITDHWSLISSRMERFVTNVAEQRGSVVIQEAITWFTFDVVGDLVFSKDLHTLEYPELQVASLQGHEIWSSFVWASKLLPNIRDLVLSMEPLIKRMFPRAPMLGLLNVIRKMVADYHKSHPRDGISKEWNVVEQLLSPKAARGYTVPNDEELVQELLGVLGGGTETTAFGATLGIYKIITESRVLHKLQAELREHIKSKNDQLTWEELEKIEYLGAIVKEITRYCAPVPGRLPRLVPKGGTYIGKEFIPAGTVVGTAAYTMHRNESIFPDGDNFVPERWLVPGAEKLDRYLITWAKGPSLCPGKNLAIAELYLMIAVIFRRFNVQIANNSAVPGKDPEYTDQLVAIFRKPKLQLSFQPIDD